MLQFKKKFTFYSTKILEAFKKFYKAQDYICFWSDEKEK